MNCTNDQYYKTSDFKYPFFIVIYSLLFIIGLPVNIAACCYLVSSKANKRLSEVKIYMISLTLADLLYIMLLPFWIDYYYHGGYWRFPAFTCSLFGSLFYINTYSTLFFLSLISFTRYLAVSRPVKTAQSAQRNRGIGVTVLVWLLIVCCSLCILIDNKNHVNKRNDNTTSCFENYTEKNEKTQLLVIHSLMLLAFVVTLGAVIGNYVLIIRRLSREQTALRVPQHKLKKKAVRMVLTVLVIYMVCFLPYHLIQLPWMLLVLNVVHSNDCLFRKTFNDVHQVTLGLMSINCVLDPVVYCFLTEDFRRYLRELTCYCRDKCVLWSKLRSPSSCI
ncbi:platelet-activating factor receptor-like [Amblyraja radiata]|uniref:platelet-activating factor receptor-like n=1 Tax=Amblyraja radiata TaxID=386614 RepID=UPI001403DE3E|nr:platelet-activating factor receptor-like [Amblyraja radiata]